jgi:hypothetical protein
MANVNSPRGIQPYSYRSGAPWGGAVRVYYVPVGNGTALFLGDPVISITNSSDGNGIQSVGIASAGGGAQILGAFMGIANNAGISTITLQQTQTPYLAASQAAYVYVTDDPTLLYWVQENGSMVSGASGRNADLVAGTGSTTTSQSGWQLASSTLNTTSTLQMRIIQGLQEVDNTIPGTNAKWLVSINDGIHPWTAGTGI